MIVPHRPCNSYSGFSAIVGRIGGIHRVFLARWLAYLALATSCGIAAADGIVLAPGKTVAVIDAGDPLIRVMVTASADQPLDLTPLLYSVGPKDSVYSIVTRMQVKEAAGLVENADGSVSLGAAPLPAAAPAATITGGTIVVLERGRYAHYKDDAQAPATQTAARPGEPVVGKKDEVPALGRVAPATPAQPVPAMAASLPTGGQVIMGTASNLSLPQTSANVVVNGQSFSIGSGGSVTFSQPGSTTLQIVNTGGQIQINGNINGSIQLSTPMGGTIGSVKALTTGSTTPTGVITVK